MLGWEPYDSIIRLLQGRNEWDRDLDDDERRRVMRLAPKYFLREDKLYRRGDLVTAPREVPAAEEVQEIIRKYHEGNNEHLGYNTITQMISKRYYWKGLVGDVKKFVQGCEVCEERRRRVPTKFELYRIVPPANLFVMVGMDTLHMPASHGFNELITMIDYTSDFADAHAVRGNTAGKDVVKAMRNWMTYFGQPHFIILDNVKYFIHGEFRNYCEREGIQQIPATKYNPRGNGKVENYNGQIQRVLARITLAREQKHGRDVKTVAKRWYPHLQDALRIRNSMVSRITGISPYQFVFGQEPPKADPLTTDILKELIERRIENFELLTHMREVAAEHRLQNRLEETEANWPKPREYREGDLVWYYNVPLHDEGMTVEKKILPKWDGPYQVEFALPGGVYWLTDGNGKRISREKINHRHLAPVRRAPEWYSYGRLASFIWNFGAEVDGCRYGFFGKHEVEYGLGSFGRVAPSKWTKHWRGSGSASATTPASSIPMIDGEVATEEAWLNEEEDPLTRSGEKRRSSGTGVGCNGGYSA